MFPCDKTSRDNTIPASKDIAYYLVSSAENAFRISGLTRHEIVYRMLTPAGLDRRMAAVPKALLARCDNNLFCARGECIDTSAGFKVSRGELLLENPVGTLLWNLVFSMPGKHFGGLGALVYNCHLAHR